MAREHGYDVVLLPTYEQAEDWRRAHARAGGGLFGQTVGTFDSWIADLWELHGDGRVPVDAITRSIAMAGAISRAFAGAGGDAAAVTAGMVQMAARCEREAAGIGEFDRAVAAAAEGGVPGLSGREVRLLAGIAAYREGIARRGLVEPGEACALLASRAGEAFPRKLRVLVAQAQPPSWRMSRFLGRCPQVDATVEVAPGADGVTRAPQGVAVRFAFPAGRYAAAGLLADLLREGRAGMRTVVSAADPLRLFAELEPELSRRGVASGVRGSVRLGDTDFGRAFLLAGQLADGGTWDPAQLADLLLSPFSGVSPRQAREADVRLRADRIAARDACLAQLRDQHPGFACLMGLASAESAPDALERLEGRVQGDAARTPAWRAVQLSAIGAVRRALAAARAFGVGAQAVRDALERISIPVSWMAPGGAVRPQVLVADQAAVARMEAGSFGRLVLADQTSADRPLADPDDAAATLFAKLGLEPVDDALSRERRAFCALVRVPSEELVVMRPLNDADGNPSYPSAMLEEFVDAYRGGAGEEGPFGLPAGLAGGVVQRGEELLYANARALDAAARQPVRARVAPPAAGQVGPVGQDVMLPPRRLREGGGLQRSPSPSQVELYLECPYKWFVSRRLKAQRLEEGFGALERGSFAHAVLERFYRRFIGGGGGKVSPQDLPEARALLREAADEVEREMPLQRPGGGRLVAATRLEEREVAQLKGRLVAYLDYEAALLPTFRPAYLEYAFGQDAPVEYAGCRLVGTIDRIDVDDAGRAVVIDYKGSVNPEHDIAGKDARHPGKVQARMYAQVVKRELGLDVVGALYVGYGRRHAVAGAADGRAIEAAHLPGMRPDAIWCAPAGAAAPAAGGEAARPYSELPFPDMLDATEALVADAVDRMERGEAAPGPANPDACAYCPVAVCPKRGA